MQTRRTKAAHPPSQYIWQLPEWPQFTWRDEAILAALGSARAGQGRLLGAARLLDNGLSIQAQAQILTEDGLNTSAIEGEKLNPGAVRSSVARHLGLPTAGLPAPPRAVDGLIEVLLDATARHAKPLTLKRLLSWHAALFPRGRSGLLKVRAGKLRGEAPMRVVSGGVGRERVHFEAPPCKVLEAELRRFLDWFRQPPAASGQPGLDGLIRAGLAHLWFVTVHPFEDGNGRLARAITDMALSQDEDRPQRLFSLSAQIMRDREAYYDILESTQKGALDVTAWLVWFLQRVALACELAESTISRVLAKARFWLVHQGTPLNERQRKVLNRLLDAGDGFEGGMNTRKYASLTGASRATAYRELADLVAKGCLAASGAGRSVVYRLPDAIRQ